MHSTVKKCRWCWLFFWGGSRGGGGHRLLGEERRGAKIIQWHCDHYEMLGISETRYKQCSPDRDSLKVVLYGEAY